MNHRSSWLQTVRTWLGIYLRQDRIVATVWILAVSGTIIGTAAGFPSIYPDHTSIAARAALMHNPSAIIMSGPAYLISQTSLGAMLTHELLLYVALAVAVMSIMLMVKHTRRDESEGRTELFATYTAYKQASFVAAFIEVSLLNLTIGLLTAIGIGSLGIASMDWHGAWLYGAALSATGIFFAAVTSLTAQLGQQPRTATSLALLTVGLSFILRAIGDVTENGLSWLSPFGWAHATRAFTNNHWWPLSLTIIASLSLFTLALLIAKRRDVGEGLLRAKTGRHQAPTWLNNSFALTFKLQRATSLTWILSGFLFGLLYGSLASEVEAFASQLDGLFLPTTDSMLDLFLVTVVSTYAIGALIAAMTSISRLKSEEQSARTEIILATPVSHRTWITNHALVAFISATAFLISASLGTALQASHTINDWNVLSTMLQASLIYIPIIAFIIGLATMLHGLSSRLIDLTWLAISFIIFVWIASFFLQLPDWLTSLSPLQHLPLWPIEPVDYPTIITISALAIILYLLGHLLIKRRDLNA